MFFCEEMRQERRWGPGVTCLPAKGSGDLCIVWCRRGILVYICRVSECLSLRPPPPPPTLGQRGETHSLAGGGGTQFGRLERKLSTLKSVYSVFDAFRVQCLWIDEKTDRRPYKAFFLLQLIFTFTRLRSVLNGSGEKCLLGRGGRWPRYLVWKILKIVWKAVK
jgi:hypothetical protein